MNRLLCMWVRFCMKNNSSINERKLKMNRGIFKICNLFLNIYEDIKLKTWSSKKLSEKRY